MVSIRLSNFSHCSKFNESYLEFLGNRIILKGKWSVRSPDLSPPDFIYVQKRAHASPFSFCLIPLYSKLPWFHRTSWSFTISISFNLTGFKLAIIENNIVRIERVLLGDGWSTRAHRAKTRGVALFCFLEYLIVICAKRNFKSSSTFI